MIQPIQVRLVVVVIRLVSVFVGTPLTVTNCLNQYQVLSGACPTAATSCKAPALIERMKAIDLDQVLMVIGEALVLFGDSH